MFLLFPNRAWDNLLTWLQNYQDIPNELGCPPKLVFIQFAEDDPAFEVTANKWKHTVNIKIIRSNGDQGIFVLFFFVDFFLKFEYPLIEIFELLKQPIRCR